MRILVSNGDGILAPELWALVSQLKNIAEVVVTESSFILIEVQQEVDGVSNARLGRQRREIFARQRAKVVVEVEHDLAARVELIVPRELVPGLGTLAAAVNNGLTLVA